MTISSGNTLPAATFVHMGPDGPAEASGGDIIGNGRVVVFGLPGAYTGVCSTAHVPSFVRSADAFRAKGVDRIVCVTVNDPFVLDAWSKDTGAGEAGITMLGDPDATFTKAIGMDFTAPPVGLINRSKRYSMLVEDGVVKILNLEGSPGECEISAGETLLDAM